MAVCLEVMMVEADRREVAFFGRITAAFTHEMKNVLAIVKESAGLMEDLLSLAQNASHPHRERFARALGTIAAQTKRGIELSNRLNRFAHSADTNAATIDAHETLEQIVFLSERFARLKGVRLNLQPGAGSLAVTLSPVAFQMAVFGCLELCWETAGSGGNVVLSVVGLQGGPPLIRFACEDGAGKTEDLFGSSDESERTMVLRKALDDLNFRIEFSTSGAGFDLVLCGAA